MGGAIILTFTLIYKKQKLIFISKYETKIKLTIEIIKEIKLKYYCKDV